MLLSMTAQAVLNFINTLLASNLSLGSGNAGFIISLGQNTVSPGSIGGWLNATFPGYTPILTIGGITNGNDSLQQQATVTIGPPSGGFRWTANSGINGTQQINSIRLDFSNGTPIATANVFPAQSVTLPNDQINIGSIQMLITLPVPPA